MSLTPVIRCLWKCSKEKKVQPIGGGVYRTPRPLIFLQNPGRAPFSDAFDLENLCSEVTLDLGDIDIDTDINSNAFKS